MPGRIAAIAEHLELPLIRAYEYSGDPEFLEAFVPLMQNVLADLERRHGWRPQLMVVGERTGERGDEIFGSVFLAWAIHSPTVEAAGDVFARFFSALTAS